MEAGSVPSVLFVCVHNSGRSQMARAFFDRISDGRIVAQSAGTVPDQEINADVVRAMAEVGVDISGKRPRMLTQEMVTGALRVITMGCGVEGDCPAVFVETVDWGIDDPKGRSTDDIRRVRDEIEARVASLWQELVGATTASGVDRKE